MLNRSAPWVIIAGGFHQNGALDKANAALADYLLRERVPVHLVAHTIDPKYQDEELATICLVDRPRDSHFLGDLQLGRVGRRVARAVTERHARARVLVNGGNCTWPDLNWVHCVHHAWPCCDEGAPLWFKTKNRLVKTIARRRERRAISVAAITLANSHRSRKDVIAAFGVDSGRVHTVYLGADPAWDIPSPAERRAARQWLQVPDGRPVVAFVGAVSHDDNKGLGTLCRAWATLCSDPRWDAHLVVAGSGNGLRAHQRWVARAGLSGRVQFLGHTSRVATLLAASDVLVSPVRYEAYGLNVQEALCRGVPAVVDRNAGVAEQYPNDLRMMLLSDPASIDELTRTMILWRRQSATWRDLVRPVADRLRQYSWTDMARRIVEIANTGPLRRPKTTG